PRAPRSPGPRTSSTWARTCTAAAAAGRSPGGRNGPARGRGASRLHQPGLGHQLAQRAAHAGQPLPLGEVAHVRARDDDDVVAGGQLAHLLGEGLAQETLDAVAVDRATDLPRHGQAETRLLLAAARERV